jgi:hypothetical protein
VLSVAEAGVPRYDLQRRARFFQQAAGLLEPAAAGLSRSRRTSAAGAAPSSWRQLRVSERWIPTPLAIRSTARASDSSAPRWFCAGAAQNQHQIHLATAIAR